MKKTLLTIILIISGVLFPQSKMDIDNLIDMDGLLYKPNDDKPYTGIVFDMSKETGNKILEGKYVKGLPHGNHVEWYNDGKKKVKGTYKSGMMNDYWTFHYENGNVKCKGSYKNGNGEEIDRELGIPKNGMVGKWTMWYENGQKEREGTYKDGERDGLWTYWNEDGQKEKEETYKDG